MKSKIAELAENAPKELIEEVRASHDMTVEEAAHMSCEDCLEGFVFEANGKVAAITGVTLESPSNLYDAVGCPWLLTSHAAFDEPRAFLVMSKALVVRWASICRILVNYVDVRFVQSLRWARHVGFEVQEAIPFGPFQVPFHPVVYRRI